MPQYEFCYVVSQESDDGQITGPVFACRDWAKTKEEAVDFMRDLLTGDGDWPIEEAGYRLIAEFEKVLEEAKPTPSLYIKFAGDMDPAILVETAGWIG